MKKRILAAVIAAVFAVLNVASALPVFALNESTMRYPTPEGYNDHDYQKLVAFLEQTDDEGVKNGEKLSENYDPNDPATWGSSYRFERIESDGELRIQIIYVDGRGLCGTLDVSGCTALSWLYCPENNLTELDVSGCTALEELWCYNNNLTELDVSGCTALYYLDCGSNNLTSLDVSGCTALQILYCSNNNLTALDVSSNTALEHLWCGRNNLAELDVSSNTALVFLLCGDNSLTELDVSNNTNLWDLDCCRNNLTTLDVRSNTALGGLACSANNLTTLDVSNNTELDSLFCSDNNLTSLDVSRNTELYYLSCSCNNLTSLDVSNNNILGHLYCFYNNIAGLDLSHNPYLLFDYVKSEGDGTIGYGRSCEVVDYGDWDYTWEGVCAVPNSNAEFIGWFNEEGEMIMSAEECSFDDDYNAYEWRDAYLHTDETVLIAKFTEAEPIPGDADGDGELTSDDVLLLMRAVMELEELTDEMLANCDMNGDGVVNFTDALIMLRMVLNTQPNIAAC